MLVINAAQPTRMQAPREGHLHRIIFFLPNLEGGPVGISPLGESRPGCIDGPTVGPRDGGHVFRRLQAAFNFERTDTRANQIRNYVDACEVLRGKEVGFIA